MLLLCCTGLLDVCVHYKHRPMRSGGRAGRGAPSQSVMLVVKVYRACGLKAAARYNRCLDNLKSLKSKSYNLVLNILEKFLTISSNFLLFCFPAEYFEALDHLCVSSVSG